MRRGRIFFYLAFILILGLVAVVVVWQRFLQPAPSTGPAPITPVATIETTNVVVVTQRVSRGDILREEVLKDTVLPREMFIPGMFNSKNEIVGRRAKFDLEAGIPLTSGMLVSSAEELSSTGSNAALSIPRGMVAVSIPINRLSSVSYAPQPGDHVNVIVSMLFRDLDTEFQSVLPNRTMGVIATGTSKMTGQSSETSGSTLTTGLDQTKSEGQGAAALEVESSSLVAVTGGGGAPQGRAEVDPVFGETFYLVPSELQRPRLVVQNLLQDVVVLHMGDFPLSPQAATQQTASEGLPGTPPGETPPEGGASPFSQVTTTQTQNVEIAAKPPDVITLIVSPQDAITLNYVMFFVEKGSAQLTLALRSAGDDQRLKTEAVTLQFLLDQYSIPIPIKLPYGPEPRLDKLALPPLANDVQVTPQP